MPILGDHLQRPTYKFLQTIGEGNNSVCRLGEHDVFHKRIVQKTISMLAIPDGVAREPELLRDARHDRIVEVWEAQWDPDPALAGLQAVTFVCPYFEGGSVYTALMDGHQFGVGDVIAITKHVLDGLAYLHESRRYLHRDVKPGNVLLAADRAGACLGDLGSAGRISDISGGADNFGGTPLYLAPEAITTGHVTVRSDIFSLGVTAIEMLGGRFPYENIDGDAVEKRLAEGKRALPDRHYAFPPHVPPALARFIKSMAHQDPQKRPATADEALRKLNRIEVVDWRRTDGSGVRGPWAGTWPPARRPDLRRLFEIAADPVTTGKRAGQVRLRARWRSPGGQWRQYRKLDRYIASGDEKGLAAFFRAVESEAQASPASHAAERSVGESRQAAKANDDTALAEIRNP